MTLPPKKPTKGHMGTRKNELRFPGHRAWVRRHGCVVQGCIRQDTQAAHISYGYPEGTPDWQKAGMGKKAHDKFTVSMCDEHHREAHNSGHETFGKKHGLDLPKMAQEFAAKSPHRSKWDG